MHLQTIYAPPTFLKPCIAIDTVYATGGRGETMAIAIEALNVDHAQQILVTKKWSDWRIIKTHTTMRAAIAFHLSYARKLHNGGTQKSWESGMGKYLELLRMFQVAEEKEREGDNDGK